MYRDAQTGGSRVPLKKFADLDLWQVAHQLSLTVYRLTCRFPKQEVYGLTSQMRRCAVSVPSNVAEGWGRRSNNLYFSPPDGRSTRYDRQDFVALACRARCTVKYTCARQAARASS